MTKLPDLSSSKWLRLIFPPILIAIWLIFSGVGGPYFGKIDQVSSNTLSDFLPATAEATLANKAAASFTDNKAIPAIVVTESDQAMTPQQLQSLQEIQQGISQINGVVQASPVVPSEDGKAAQIIALVDTSAETKDVVDEMRHLIADSSSSLSIHVTGPAGFAADLLQAFSGIDGLLLVVALSVVLIILLVIYRSPILPFVVLITSIAALSVSVLIVWWLAKWGIVQINGQVQGILFILVIGAATDYSLLYVSRLKEALHHTESPSQAAIQALKGSFEPILASGGTVIAGLLCLLLSDLNSNKYLGPVASIGIVMAMLSAFTLLPSLLALAGRKAFWPFPPQVDPNYKDEQASHGLWNKVASVVDKYPRVIWAVIILLLCTAALGASSFKADGISQSQLIVGQSDARDGLEVLSRHFPSGSGSPTIVVARAAKMNQLVEAIEDIDGVSSVSAISDNSPSGSVPLGKNKALFGPLAQATPKQIGDQIVLQVTLANEPDSVAAEQTVILIRQQAHQIDNSSLVGGETAVNLDTRQAANHDRNTIIPVVLIVITIILMILLRSILMPIVLIWTTVISFIATLGVSSFVFDHLFNMPGSDPVIPLYAFVFLVALGIDYNIFLMTRVREESLVHGVRRGMLRGLVITGGVITSAGLVLASTFAALSVIPILFLTQIAFIVAFGVLLDTIVVRSLLVPALVRDAGPTIWWPSKLWRAKK